MPKPTKYHAGDLVRVNFNYNWSIPQLVQLKQQHSIVSVLDGPRTEEGVVQYQIKLQDVIWVPRAALLRRANEKERQAYANAVGDCEHRNKTDHTKEPELDLKFKDLDTPAIDADSSGSFADTLKQLFRGISDTPVEPLKQDDKDTEKTHLPPLLGTVIDKMSDAGDILSALLHGLFADMPPAASGDSSRMSVRLRYLLPPNKSWEMRLHMRQRLQASMVYRFLHLQRYRRNVLQIQVIAGKSRI